MKNKGNSGKKHALSDRITAVFLSFVLAVSVMAGPVPAKAAEIEEVEQITEQEQQAAEEEQQATYTLSFAFPYESVWLKDKGLSITDIPSGTVKNASELPKGPRLTGRLFKGWLRAKEDTVPIESITVTESATLYGLYVTAYSVQVSNGTGGGEYAQGDAVTVTAEDSETGAEFKGWTGTEGLGIADTAQKTITFAMPASNVTLTAVYEEPVHVHSGTYVEAVAADCTMAGHTAYYACACGKWFHDSECTEEINDHNSVLVPAAHDFSVGKWDNEKHWNKCSRCTAVDVKEEHIYDDDGDTTCNVCEYVRTIGGEEEENPDPPKEGKLEIGREQGAGTPHTDFGMEQGALAQAVLTVEELETAKTDDVQIILSIDNADASVSEEDRQLIAAQLNGYTVGQYLDINLYKVIGEDRTQVAATPGGKVRITVTMPYGLRNTDRSKKRTYAVIRVHDGVAAILPDEDEDAATVTFASDLYSIYAIVYQDTDIQNEGSGQENGNTGGDNQNAGDTGNTGNNQNTDTGNTAGETQDKKDETNTAGEVQDKKDETDTAGDGSIDVADNDGNDSVKKDTKAKKKGKGPMTGDTRPLEIYATVAMVAGFSWLYDFFGKRRMGLTEQEKQQITARLIAWGRNGGRLRKAMAVLTIFMLLAYYHSIGKRTEISWKEIYGGS